MAVESGFGRPDPTLLARNGSVHVRLADANGDVQFDYTNKLVIGPSGGGGGGGSVDPTTVASTGDTKFRPTGELVAGWVKLNGTTIGNATSGATQRANADTQALFVYAWTNCATRILLEHRRGQRHHGIALMICC